MLLSPTPRSSFIFSHHLLRVFGGIAHGLKMAALFSPLAVVVAFLASTCRAQQYARERSIPFSHENGKCPLGFYKVPPPNIKVTQTYCHQCPPGRYGSSFELTSQLCSGPCAPGYFGDQPGAKSSTCSGKCDEGYFCPKGSRSSKEKHCGSVQFYCPLGSGIRYSVSAGFYTIGETASTRKAQIICEPGHYCRLGIKRECEAGRFGNASGLSDANCTGVCPAGYYCPKASVNPTPCPAGTFGNRTGLSDPLCSGKTPKGSYTLAAATKTVKCPPGRFGSTPGLTSDACSELCNGDYCVPTVCEEGYYCPAGSSSGREYECGSSAYFCPKGSNVTTLVHDGFYTAGGSSNATRTYQIQCEPGHYCTGGTRHHCSAGKYGSAYGMSSSNCSGNCAPGHYCPLGSTRAGQYQCGGADKYCPGAQGLPFNVSAGYYSVGGGVGRRSNQSICEAGYYCKNGIRRKCPAGTYGSEPGLQNRSCSGLCSKGHYCPKGSVSPVQEKCPSGSFGDREGLMTNACSGLCEAGWWCEEASASPRQHACSEGIIAESKRGVPSDKVYCPSGSKSPKAVDPGYYASGGEEGTRTGQTACDKSNDFHGICPDATVE